VWSTLWIPLERKFVQLWNRDSERVVDAFQPAGPFPSRRSRNLLQEVTPERIINTVRTPIGFADHLGNKVKVARGRKELSDNPEASIRIDLL
jgi:hypothetical protein